MADASTHTHGEDGKRDLVEIQFDDPDNFTQGERLRSILHSRKECLESRREVTYARQLNRLKQEALAMYRDAVEAYLMDLWPLSLEDDTNEAENVNHYWHKQELGEIVITPGVALVDHPVYGEVYQEQATDKNPEVYDTVRPAKRQIDVVGLESILNLPEDISATFAYTKPGNVPPGEFSRSTQVPKPILDRAFRTADAFRREVGLDVDAGGEVDEHGQPF